MTAAMRPAKLSTPELFITSDAAASAPLPENGRSSTSGVSSAGTPRRSSSGRTAAASSSNAPEARSM